MRIEEQGRAAAARLADRLEATARADLGPDVVVERRGDGVMLSGAGLKVRRIVDPALRDLAVTAVRT